MNLNFNASANSFVSTSLPVLKPWEIHEVVFDGCEYTTFEGKKDPTQTYEVFKISFRNENGRYTETLFAPKAGDDVRRTRKNANGHEVEMPSNLETLVKTIGHFLTAVAPEVLEKLLGKQTSFKSLCEGIQKATDKYKGKKSLKLKLIAGKDGKPRLPYILSIFKNGEDSEITNNCMGENLYFTDYELGQKDKFENEKPTSMASVNAAAPSESAADDDDFNFDLPID